MARFRAPISCSAGFGAICDQFANGSVREVCYCIVTLAGDDAMEEPTVFLSRLIGLVSLIVAVPMLLDKPSMMATFGLLVEDRGLMLVLGIASVVAGAAIVLLHNVWNKGLWPLIVTLCGWALLIRGILILFLPGDVLASLLTALRVTEYFYAYAALPLLIGAYLCFRGFTATSAAAAPAPPPQPIAKPQNPARRPRRRR
jgi:hypothetical protein